MNLWTYSMRVWLAIIKKNDCVLWHQFVQQLALYVWLFHVCLCPGLVPFGGPERRPPRCEDVLKAPDRDDAEPTPLFSPLNICQVFQHRFDGRQLGLDLPEG